jgi:Ser/Thr protein kinase RdoA (MazF antagonist)
MTAGIVRRGSRLLRPMGPWSPAVHEFLGHLEEAGFGGAPRVLGTEGDREVLTFIEGDVAADPYWRPGHGHRLPPYARTERALRTAAQLIRKLHSAAAGYRPTITSYRFHPYPPGSGEIVCHGDLGPWNTVYRGGRPIAFIDWDGAQPADPLDDLAAAAWAFVPLAPPGRLAEAGFDPPPELAARLRTFLDAYGLTEPKAILPALQRCTLAAAERLRYWPVSPAEAADSLEFLAAELRWLQDISPDLARGL